MTLASHESLMIFSFCFSSKYLSLMSLCRATYHFFVFGSERHHSSTSFVVSCDASSISGFIMSTVEKFSSSQS
jgi:hypothetical protein